MYISTCDEAEVMESTNTLRLGIFLNYCGYLYEVLGQVDDARYIAKKAFDEALKDFERLSKEEMEKVLPVM